MSKTTYPSSASQALQSGNSPRVPERQPPPCTTTTAGCPPSSARLPSAPLGRQTSTFRSPPAGREYVAVSGGSSAATGVAKEAGGGRRPTPLAAGFWGPP